MGTVFGEGTSANGLLAARRAAGLGRVEVETMPEKDDRVRYADCMTFIRYRLHVVDRFLQGCITTGYRIPDIETIALQFRKVFELIAMASLCANKDRCEEVKHRFNKLWNAKEILAFVARLNPNYYPVAIGRQMPRGGEPGVVLICFNQSETICFAE